MAVAGEGAASIPTGGANEGAEDTRQGSKNERAVAAVVVFTKGCRNLTSHRCHRATTPSRFWVAAGILRRINVDVWESTSIRAVEGAASIHARDNTN
uniref:Uncharacterized protein n=1 Tax=Oryza sativa subsp. japonica TaxID=39947 RepID=Q9FW20_ORYSJ|nr:hypothetical protein [Oryza sativa Japonica Group]AAK84445.1 hypothetical protein [Oryza sativa Japonica Group]